ncbi:amidohydrolase family protein [Saccharopolyspora sp. 5N708]
MERAGEAAIVVDARDAIVVPGFVDSHVHAWEGQLRGLAAGIDFPTYMSMVHGDFAPQYTPDDMYLGNLLTALNALDGGVTTILDNSHNTRTPEHLVASVEGLADAGIRAVHASAPPTDGSVDQGSWLQAVEDARVRYFASEDQLLSLRLLDLAPTEDLWRYARDQGMWVSTEMGRHITNLAELASAGLLTPEHTFNHCIELPPDDWRLIADAGATVNVCPRSDAHFGLGQATPPIDQALEHGLVPGISMDNELSYGADMFVEMQHLMTLHRGATFTRLASGDSGENLLPEQALTFATLGGAINCGLADVAGSLTPGKQADVVLVRRTDLNTSPSPCAFTTLLGFANRGNVDTVFVAGRVRKWRGSLVGHDLPRILGAAESSRDRMLAALKLSVDSFSLQSGDNAA